jgi:Right handed beta helix region
MNFLHFLSKKSYFGRRSSLAVIALAMLFLFAMPSVFSSAASGLPQACVKAGGTGLTTYMVIAKPNVVVNGKTIDASGCDIGIYVAPGANNVRITHTTVIGANDHGIFAQDVSHVVIKNNLIEDNGVNGGHSCNFIASPCIDEDKGLQLAGSSNSVIANNIVNYNGADGGIGVTTDGPILDPGAIQPSATKLYSAINNKITGNTIVDNAAGCGIVLSTYNPGTKDQNTLITGNTIVGNSPFTQGSGPEYVGQIVVATDAPFTSIFKTYVISNSLDGSLLPGIVVHANVFGDKIAWLWIEHNNLADNGWYPPTFSTGSNDPGEEQGPTGIALIAEHNVQPPGEPNPIISHAWVIDNTILSDRIGVWHCFTTHTTIQDVDGNAKIRIAACPGGA